MVYSLVAMDHTARHSSLDQQPHPRRRRRQAHTLDPRQFYCSVLKENGTLGHLSHCNLCTATVNVLFLHTPGLCCITLPG